MESSFSRIHGSPLCTGSTIDTVRHCSSFRTGWPPPRESDKQQQGISEQYVQQKRDTQQKHYGRRLIHAWLQYEMTSSATARAGRPAIYGHGNRLSICMNWFCSLSGRHNTHVAY